MSDDGLGFPDLTLIPLGYRWSYASNNVYLCALQPRNVTSVKASSNETTSSIKAASKLLCFMVLYQQRSIFLQTIHINLTLEIDETLISYDGNTDILSKKKFEDHNYISK